MMSFRFEFLVRSCVALAPIAFSRVDASEISRDEERSSSSSSSSSLLMTTVFASFGLSITAVLLIICCFFFQKKRLRHQAATRSDAEEGNSETSVDAVDGKRWHQLQVATTNNTGDARSAEIHESPITAIKSEMSQVDIESKGPQRNDRRVASIGTKPSEENSDLETTGKISIEKRNSLHSSAESSETEHFEAVVLTSEDDSGLGMTFGKNSDGEIFVEDIDPNGPAMKAKRIRRGDRISSLAISMENMNLEHARTLLDLARYYPIELHLKKRSTAVDVHDLASDLDEPLGSSSGHVLPDRSKSLSVNYLPTKDDDLKIHDRPSSSFNQLPASGELSSRWRFENQPHIGNRENEADDVRVIGARLQQEVAYKTGNENFWESDENLEGKEEDWTTRPKCEPEDIIPPPNHSIEGHAEKLVASNWSDLELQFPNLGINSENKMGKSLLEDILPHFSEIKGEQPSETNSEEDEFNKFKMSTELNKYEENVQSRKLNIDSDDQDFNENFLKVDSRNRFEITEFAQSQKDPKKSVENAENSMNFFSYNQDAEYNMKTEQENTTIEPYFGKSDVNIESLGSAAKTRFDSYNSGEENEDGSEEDEDKNTDSLVLYKAETADDSDPDGCVTGRIKSPNLSSNSADLHLKNEDCADLEGTGSTTTSEGLPRSPSSSRVIDSKSPFDPRAETSQSPTSEDEQTLAARKHQTVSYYERFCEAVTTGLPLNIVDLDDLDLNESKPGADLPTASPKTDSSIAVTGPESPKTDSASKGDKSNPKGSNQTSPVLTKDSKRKGSSIGDRFKEFFSSKTIAKQNLMQSECDVGIVETSKVPLSNGTNLAETGSKADDAIQNSLSKKETYENFDGKLIPIKPYGTKNGISNDVIVNQTVIENGESEKVTMSLEERINDRTGNRLRNNEEQMSYSQNSFEKAESENPFPVDIEMKNGIDTTDHEAERQNGGISRENKSEKENFNISLGRDVLSEFFHRSTSPEKVKNGGETMEGKEVPASISNRSTVTSSLGNYVETRMNGTEDHPSGAFREIDSQTGSNSPSNVGSKGHDPDSADTFLDWSKLTLEPLELPWDSLGFDSSSQSRMNGYGDVHLDTNSSSSNNDEAESVDTMIFSGTEIKRGDKNNNLLIETSDA